MIQMNPFPLFSKPSFSIYANDHQKLDVKNNLSSFPILQHAFSFIFVLLLFTSYAFLIQHWELCSQSLTMNVGLNFLMDFDYFLQNHPICIFFQASLLEFIGLKRMINILSTPRVVGTRFWPLNSLDIEFFRETLVFTYLFLCGNSALMGDQSSHLLLFLVFMLWAK